MSWFAPKVFRHAVWAGQVLLLSAGLAASQTARDSRPAEQVFKNIQLMKGVPADEFLSTMGFISASLGISCVDCHNAESGGDWAKYADDDNPRKRMARKMIAMVSTMNKDVFGGRRVLTCYTCHRGANTPDTTPELAQIYALVQYREPDKLVKPFPGAAEPNEVLKKFVRAIGGEQKVSGLSTFAAKGTYQTYGMSKKFALEMYAKAPAQRTIIVHNLAGGDIMQAYDGKDAWTIEPAILTPIAGVKRTGGELNSEKLWASLSFPGQIDQLLTAMRVGPPAVIDDSDMTMVQGTMDGKYLVNLYFDDKTGLLSRAVTFTDSPIGMSPVQVDYSDYRDVAGVKLPHKMVQWWLDGKTTIEITEVQPNLAIDPVKFSLGGQR